MIARRFRLGEQFAIAAARPEALSVLIESAPGSTLCFDAFSSREPVSTSLENALRAGLPEIHDALGGRWHQARVIRPRGFDVGRGSRPVRTEPQHDQRTNGRPF